MNELSARLTSTLAQFNEKINEVCPPRIQLGPNVEPIEFKIEINSDGMGHLYSEGIRTGSVPIDDLPFSIASMLEALEIVETLNT